MAAPLWPFRATSSHRAVSVYRLANWLTSSSWLKPSAREIHCCWRSHRAIQRPIQQHLTMLRCWGCTEAALGARRSLPRTMLTSCRRTGCAAAASTPWEGRGPALRLHSRQGSGRGCGIESASAATESAGDRRGNSLRRHALTHGRRVHETGVPPARRLPRTSGQLQGHSPIPFTAARLQTVDQQNACQAYRSSPNNSRRAAGLPRRPCCRFCRRQPCQPTGQPRPVKVCKRGTNREA